MSPLTSIDGLSEAAAWAEEVASTLSSGRTVVLDGSSGAVERTILAGTHVAPVIAGGTAWLFVAPDAASWELQALEAGADRPDRTWPLAAPPAGPPLVVDGKVYVSVRAVDDGRPSLCAYPTVGSAPTECLELRGGDGASPGMAAAEHSIVVPLGRLVVSVA